ncbi:hypothetical protein [Methanocorpusculum vombati]|uniref:Uncharacterized protein n=1 Tax=Methanocorpusculum vombati TaxID=3002864 RepID=A0ABT4IKJ1_9EURY|nr:hypothetical protein [Methanocorpusculum vombati]MCZ9319566.1 hypothetical protein [Methanocorpusculum sp.]MCZ0862256.1 hypothetical protein [Methanocorpusculum vombati]MDE2519734.1 hypothetical protein [Methanocorpusculum sp.]MDE2534484.1 hypothetical protein [Methanocorpusculum sp.]MDE2546133.1 hypothetical protein [Methanocorpusculum sp.]
MAIPLKSILKTLIKTPKKTDPLDPSDLEKTYRKREPNLANINAGTAVYTPKKNAIEDLQYAFSKSGGVSVSKSTGNPYAVTISKTTTKTGTKPTVTTTGKNGTTTTGNKTPSPPVSTPDTPKISATRTLGGTLTTAGLGALAGAAGTAYMTASNEVEKLKETITQIISGNENNGNSGGDGDGKNSGDDGEQILPWQDAEDAASGLLNGLSDVPGLGSIITDAEENGYSLPIFLLIAIIALLIIRAIWNHLKKRNQKTPAKRTKTTRKNAPTVKT